MLIERGSKHRDRGSGGTEKVLTKRKDVGEEISQSLRGGERERERERGRRRKGRVREEIVTYSNATCRWRIGAYNLPQHELQTPWP